MSTLYRKKYKEIANSQSHSEVRDLSEHWYNIDTIFDAIVEEESLRGKEPSLELAVFDVDTGEKYRRFQKRSEEEEERYQLSKGTTERKSETTPISESGKAEWDAAHKKEEEQIYLCEWCSKLGYQKKYNPELCDTCDICASCNEFEHYECSGCSYSRYRTGKPYSEMVSIDNLLSEEDQKVFSAIRNKEYNNDGCYVYEGSFSIKDF